MINDAEHFLTCFLVIRSSLGENSLFCSVPHFLIGLFGFLGSNFLSSLYTLDISPLSDDSYTLVYVAFHWSLANLPEDTPLKKN